MNRKKTEQLYQGKSLFFVKDQPNLLQKNITTKYSGFPLNHTHHTTIGEYLQTD